MAFKVNGKLWLTVQWKQNIEITKLYGACITGAILVQFGSSNCMEIKKMSQFYGL